MAKMRGVKPETFTDDKILQVEPLARWLFVGMWTQACDNGHVEDNHVQLKVRLLAVDNCDVSDLIAQLVHAGLITRHDGFLKIPNLTKHQKIDKRYLVFCKWCENDADPTFTKEDKQTRDRSKKPRAHRAHDGQTANAQGVPGDEGEGEGEGERDTQSKPSRKTRIPDDWEPTSSHKKRATEKNLDLNEEAEKFRNWAIANDRKYVDWGRTFSNWLINARPKPKETFDPWQM